MLEPLLELHVKPFYLRMMGLNALTARPEVLDGVRASAAAVTTDEVVGLLGGLWRARVMGAWYALSRPAADVRESLAESVRTSAGTLTAPPLAVVACVVLGADALDALGDYARRAAADDHLGADGFVAAAIESVGGPEAGSKSTGLDREHLRRMTAVADRLA